MVLTSLKDLSTSTEAKAHAEKQAAGKVKKGYKEAKVKAVKKAVKKKVVKKIAAKKKATKKKAVKKKTTKKKTTKKKVAKKKSVKKKATKKKATKKAPAKGKAGQVDQKARKAILKAVKEDGFALMRADKSLKSDREIVLAAVKQDKNALEYASEALQKDEELRPKELTVCGSQLIVDFAEYSLRDVNSKKKLREVLLEYLPTYNEGDRNSGLLLPPDSVEDSEGNSVELAIKRSGELIPRPKKGKVLFVSYYSYDHEVYKVALNSDEPVTAVGKKFDGERYITGYEQGGQEFCGHEKSVGEHNGHVSWCLLAHNKTHPFMNDLRGIDCESETDMDEIVDEVFAFLEKLSI